MRQARPVEVEDILGREPVRMELDRVGRYLQNEVVMVTGAGGSIGSELCRQISRVAPRKLILLDHAEDNLFRIQRELEDDRHVHPSSMAVVLADCKEGERMREVFAEHRPTVVFHAAAYKHVGLMELNPVEAVRNNALATRLLARVAGEHDVRRFVLVSTDKAVAPATVMGASKALAEFAVEAAQDRWPNTRYAIVRFGNVLGSSGSVVPIFRRQIALGGPLTVTDKRMTRYFMTIPEAVQLVIRAGSLGTGGEIFVLEMGEPVSIWQLAETMIELSGLRPGEDIAIEEVGRRPGEKLHEELFNPYERTQPTPADKILRAERDRLDVANCRDHVRRGRPAGPGGRRRGAGGEGLRALRAARVAARGDGVRTRARRGRTEPFSSMAPCMSSILALSVSDKIDQYGAYAGFASVLGLAVLSLLYFAQAREVKRLREWAGRSPERAAELQERAVAAAQQRAIVAPQRPATPVGRARARRCAPGARPAAATPAGQAQGAPAARARRCRGGHRGRCRDRRARGSCGARALRPAGARRPRRRPASRRPPCRPPTAPPRRLRPARPRPAGAAPGQPLRVPGRAPRPPPSRPLGARARARLPPAGHRRHRRDRRRGDRGRRPAHRRPRRRRPQDAGAEHDRQPARRRARRHGRDQDHHRPKSATPAAAPAPGTLHGRGAQRHHGPGPGPRRRQPAAEHQVQDRQRDQRRRPGPLGDARRVRAGPPRARPMRSPRRSTSAATRSSRSRPARKTLAGDQATVVVTVGSDQNTSPAQTHAVAGGSSWPASSTSPSAAPSRASAG